MSYSDEQLHDMSDEDLEAAFKAAKEELNEADVEQEYEEPETGSEESSADTEADLDEGTSESDDEPAAEESAQDKVDSEQADEDTKVEDPADTEVKPADVPQKMVFKANGKDYEFTDEEIKRDFPRVFGQAMDYTKKLQQIKPWRKTIDAIEQAKLGHDDINLMIDVLKGDKDAIAAVLKRTGVDALDINTEESNYQARDYGRTEQELNMNEVLNEIRFDPEYATTHRVLSQDWDLASWQVLSSDPRKIKQLHHDIKTGVFARVQAEADKIRMTTGSVGSDLDLYAMAARSLYETDQRKAHQQQLQAVQAQETLRQQEEQSRLNAVKRQQQQREAVKQDASRRQAAAPTGRSTARQSVTNYLDASDEDYEAWYAKLQDL